MDDKQIKKVWGDRVCTGLCAIGVLAMVAGLVGFGLALFIGQNDVLWITFLIAFGSGLATYTMGAALWNLIEITITSRMILRELQQMKKHDNSETQKKMTTNLFAKIDELEKMLNGK